MKLFCRIIGDVIVIEKQSTNRINRNNKIWMFVIIRISWNTTVKCHKNPKLLLKSGIKKKKIIVTWKLSTVKNVIFRVYMTMYSFVQGNFFFYSKQNNNNNNNYSYNNRNNIFKLRKSEFVRSESWFWTILVLKINLNFENVGWMKTKTNYARCHKYVK